jgi:hypothetical protein
MLELPALLRPAPDAPMLDVERDAPAPAEAELLRLDAPRAESLRAWLPDP